MPEPSPRSVFDHVLCFVETRLEAAERPLVVGIGGAQGAGKTTLLGALSTAFAAHGLRAETLSLDDFYLRRAERNELSRKLHPLFATRGVPGTHDTVWLRRVIAELKRAEGALVPRFDKAADDRLPTSQWYRCAPGAVDAIFVEGWCMGLPAQTAAELTEPLNALERDEDAAGVWRNAVNAALGGPYQLLFADLDALVALVPPSFEVVLEWRGQQERALLAALEAEKRGEPAMPSGPGSVHVRPVTSQAGVGLTLGDAELERFVAHFERLTRHGCRQWPDIADFCVFLDTSRRVSRTQLLEQRAPDT